MGQTTLWWMLLTQLRSVVGSLMSTRRSLEPRVSILMSRKQNHPWMDSRVANLKLHDLRVYLYAVHA